MVLQVNQLLEITEINEAKNHREVFPVNMAPEVNQAREVMEINQAKNHQEIQVQENFHNKEEILKEMKEIQEETEGVKLSL